nr:hypothetical protein [Sphingopyxis indica]
MLLRLSGGKGCSDLRAHAWVRSHDIGDLEADRRFLRKLLPKNLEAAAERRQAAAFGKSFGKAAVSRRDEGCHRRSGDIFLRWEMMKNGAARRAGFDGDQVDGKLGIAVASEASQGCGMEAFHHSFAALCLSPSRHLKGCPA